MVALGLSVQFLRDSAPGYPSFLTEAKIEQSNAISGRILFHKSGQKGGQPRFWGFREVFERLFDLTSEVVAGSA